MGIFSKLFGSKKAEAPIEPAVIVRFNYGQLNLDPMYALEDALEGAIVAAGAGVLDGHEIAIDASHGFFYMYGPDGDRLYAVAKPLLEASDFMRGAEVTIRYGSVHDQEAPKKLFRLDAKQV